MQISARDNAAFDAYYAALSAYAGQGVTHEQATRKGFMDLLDTYGKTAGWTLILEKRLGSGKVPDGTLQDGDKIPRGYWEAKDTKDDLDAEIQAKIKIGYPLTNTIFENTRRAVLYQNQQRALDADLRQPQELAGLLTRFFGHTSEQIDEYHLAVREFEGRIPDLAQGLRKRIEDARDDNPVFAEAFAQFHELCRGALNPNIAAPVIEEMLVQHLLTERLFRTVFDNPEFAKRNVIAGEIEKVIAALTSQSFSRQAFLKQLDYFYAAIEETARTIPDFSKKQDFLNHVSERFFQGFSRATADTHGIVYTPQAIVDFMCQSVEDVLQAEFGVSLSDKGVTVLDPCTGTGNFLVNLLRRISPLNLRHKYERELFCNEVMLLPYYVASLNIEHAFFEATGRYQPFEGICFADTLGMAEGKQLAMGFSEENTERVKLQKAAPITVIIGNPPYNVGQQNENDNNKNRAYTVVDGRIRETYAKDSKATNRKALSDAYVKFFRWATDRLQGQDGIVCYVSNNSFVDQIAFDGMRKHLARDFTQIYHLDLHGNVRRNPKLSGTTHNVFGIQVGVGITVAVRKAGAEPFVKYHRVPENWRKTEKWAFLSDAGSITGIADWQTLTPDAHGAWLTEGMQADFDAFLPIGSKEAKATAHGGDVPAIFKSYGRGVATCRDNWVYDFDKDALAAKAKRLTENYNAEVDRWNSRVDKTLTPDAFVNNDHARFKWSESLKQNLVRGKHAEFSEAKLCRALYRPFCVQHLFFDRILNERVYQMPFIFPLATAGADNAENSAFIVGGYERKEFSVLASQFISDVNFFADPGQCFPFYTYDEDGTNRRENITDWAVAQFQARYGAGVTKRDIFHYVYAVLHHPDYRARYRENLKRDLPRIPLVGGAHTFRGLADAGNELAALHTGYESAPEYPLKQVVNKTVPFSWRVTKMRLSPDKTDVLVNDALTLGDVPPEAFAYRLGNRSALEWVLDQYQVTTDKRSGITSDPNRQDDPEYIARLVGRVVHVSVETARIVAALPPLLAPAVPVPNSSAILP